MTEDALIYIADDEPELLDVMTEALETAGYRVEAFPDGEQLLQAVEANAPDLILLDINMPGRSGWEIQGALRDDLDTGHIPVIAVTAQGGASVEQSATSTLGFTDFLRKPFKMADLWKKVEVALSEA